MNKNLFLIMIVIVNFLTIDLFAKDEKLLADLDGDGKKEKIVISYSSKPKSAVNGSISLIQVFGKNKLLFSYNKFDKLTPFIGAKIINTKKAFGMGYRDIVFIFIGECGVDSHILYCRVEALDEHGKKIKVNYILKKDIIQIENCY